VPPDDESAPIASAFWSGTITFGLVSIPVALFPANRTVRVSLRMLAADGTPLARRYYDPESGRELGLDEIVRGYEVEPDEFVVVEDAELEALAPERTRDIDLRRFVDAGEIDPLWFERAYFLAPAGNSNKAYRLLAATMEQTGRAGVATFVMRGKEYLVAILAEGGILRAETLRFAEEIRTADAVGLPEHGKPKPGAVSDMRRALRSLAADELDPAELEDHQAARLLELIESKRKRGEGVVEAPAAALAEEDGEEGGVIDLMALLKRSLEHGAADAPQERKGPRRAPARSRARPGSGARSSGTRSSRTAGKSGARSPKGGQRRGKGGRALAELTRDELYRRAQELDIPGRSGMDKQALIRAIRAA
jgi:DNA end-binding protein Ku